LIVYQLFNAAWQIYGETPIVGQVLRKMLSTDPNENSPRRGLFYRQLELCDGLSWICDGAALRTQGLQVL